MEQKKLRWYNISLVAFTMVWGIGNVVNNFANQGMQVVVSWILIMALYFIPYALIVGELGATFPNSNGGVSYWIEQTSGKRLAFYAAWTYWIVHIPYLAQKPQSIMIALSWMVKGNGDFVNTISPLASALLSLAIFLIFLLFASKGVTTLNRIGGLAGTAGFIMSILLILLAVAAPGLTNADVATEGLTNVSTYIPTFNFGYFTTVSMLVFAVGGAEKISPYVNNTKNPSKEFPKGMIIMAIMVSVSAILGSIAMGILFNANSIPKDLMANGAYVAFQKLGDYYGVGNSLMVLFALTNALGQAAALALSIDAPLKIFLADANPKFIPNFLTKKDKNGVLRNGYIFTGILVSIIILIPIFGMGNLNDIYKWLLNLNSVVMPMRYMWVFLAFILVKKSLKTFPAQYKFIKNKKIAIVVGAWCFIFTAFACILGMIPKLDYQADPKQWMLQLISNIVTPIVLVALGMILPAIAKRTNQLSDD